MTAETADTNQTTVATPTGWGEPRSKTVTWFDPMVGATQGMQMAGIDHLRAIAAGDLPPAPIATHFDFDITEVDEGRVSFTCRPDESAYNPIGVVHGGLVCTLLDSVTACAVHSALPVGKGYTSIEIKVSYLKPVTSGSGLLTATGTLVKIGSRVGFGEGVVVDEAGATVATATSTCLVFDLPS